MVEMGMMIMMSYRERRGTLMRIMNGRTTGMGKWFPR